MGQVIWGDVETSILSIDSFRAFDTTRTFALKTVRSFEGENPLLERFPAKFTLNRIMGGRDIARFAGIPGVSAVMRFRDAAAVEADLDADGAHETSDL